MNHRCRDCQDLVASGMFLKEYLIEEINCFKSDCPLFNPEQVDCQ